MADKTHIEWTDATWNPVTGCSIVSPGCTHCYAMKLAGTRLKHIPSRIGLTTMTKAGPVWNGTVRFNPGWLLQPISWRKPRNIFVCAHGDLFHEDVPDAWIDRVFAVMALSPQHTFQVLTKRSARMREYLAASRASPVGMEALYITLQDHAVNDRSTLGDGVVLTGDIPHLKAWPLPNVWLGVSAERQQEADVRIPDLLATPAAVRFISAEPLLGPLDLSKPFDSGRPYLGLPIHQNPHDGTWHQYGRSSPHLDWVIVGCESGTGARPMEDEWARSIRDQCAAAGVAAFIKQISGADGRAVKNISLFPRDLQIRELPNAA